MYDRPRHFAKSGDVERMARSYFSRSVEDNDGRELTGPALDLVLSVNRMWIDSLIRSTFLPEGTRLGALERVVYRVISDALSTLKHVFRTDTVLNWLRRLLAFISNLT